jgi:hypothetical protein
VALKFIPKQFLPACSFYKLDVFEACPVESS